MPAIDDKTDEIRRQLAEAQAQIYALVLKFNNDVSGIVAANVPYGRAMDESMHPMVAYLIMEMYVNLLSNISSVVRMYMSMYFSNGVSKGYDLVAWAMSISGKKFQPLRKDGMSLIVGSKTSEAMDNIKSLRGLNIGADTYSNIVNGIMDAIRSNAAPSSWHEFFQGSVGTVPSDMLRISKTEPVRAYRDGLVSAYRDLSEYLSGWVWHSARTPTTCAVCWALHGTVHRVNEDFSDHANGKCLPIPLPRGETPGGLGISRGVEMFDYLPEEQKLAVLGKGKYAKYKAGMRISKLVGVRETYPWGKVYYERPLSDL